MDHSAATKRQRHTNELSTVRLCFFFRLFGAVGMSIWRKTQLNVNTRNEMRRIKWSYRAVELLIIQIKSISSCGLKKTLYNNYAVHRKKQQKQIKYWKTFSTNLLNKNSTLLRMNKIVRVKLRFSMWDRCITIDLMVLFGIEMKPLLSVWAFSSWYHANRPLID